MAKMNIVITAPQAAFEAYADKLGYSPTIATFVDEVPVPAPNPQTRADYLAEKVKGIVSTALAASEINAINATKSQEARDAGIAIREAIEGATNVTFTA